MNIQANVSCCTAYTYVRVYESVRRIRCLEFGVLRTLASDALVMQTERLNPFAFWDPALFGTPTGHQRDTHLGPLFRPPTT